MFHYHILTRLFMVVMLVASGSTMARSEAINIKNFQQTNEWMVSSGLPTTADFPLLKERGVARVIDLIPGDRNEERLTAESLGLEYFNIQVDWENPTLDDFKRYVEYMNKPLAAENKVLTHCKLNWRGSVFIYLYRVTQLNDDEKVARADLDSIWQVNDTWEAYIKTVKAHYTQ